MTSSSVILLDNSLLSRIDRYYFKLESWLNLLGGFTILVLVVLALINVLGRWLFNLPVTGYIDWIEQGMTFFAFLGIAYCQRMGSHIRMEIVVGRLRGRALWISELITTFLMLGITIVLIYGSFLHASRAYKFGDSTINIDLPTWPAKLIVPVALSILAIRLLLQIWAYMRAIKDNPQQAIAVPVIESTVNQALHETEILSDKDKQDS